MILRFFRNMAAFDAGYFIGVVLGAITGAVAVLASNAVLALAKAMLS